MHFLKQRDLRCFTCFPDDHFFGHTDGVRALGHYQQAAIGQNSLVILENFVGNFRDDGQIEIPLRLQVSNAGRNMRA